MKPNPQRRVDQRAIRHRDSATRRLHIHRPLPQRDHPRAGIKNHRSPRPQIDRPGRRPDFPVHHKIRLRPGRFEPHVQTGRNCDPVTGSRTVVQRQRPVHRSENYVPPGNHVRLQHVHHRSGRTIRPDLVNHHRNPVDCEIVHFQNRDTSVFYTGAQNGNIRNKRRKSHPADSRPRIQTQTGRFDMNRTSRRPSDRPAGHHRNIPRRRDSSNRNGQIGDKPDIPALRHDFVNRRHRNSAPRFHRHRPRPARRDPRTNTAKRNAAFPRHRHMSRSRQNRPANNNRAFRSRRFQKNIPLSVSRHASPFVKRDSAIHRPQNDRTIPRRRQIRLLGNRHRRHQSIDADPPGHHADRAHRHRSRIENINPAGSRPRRQRVHPGRQRIRPRTQRPDSRSGEQPQPVGHDIHPAGSPIQNRSIRRRNRNVAGTQNAPQNNIVPGMQPDIPARNPQSPSGNNTSRDRLQIDKPVCRNPRLIRENQRTARQQRHVPRIRPHIRVHQQIRSRPSRFQPDVPAAMTPNGNPVLRSRTVVQHQIPAQRPHHDRTVPRDRRHIRLRFIRHRRHRPIRAHPLRHHRNVSNHQSIRRQNINTARTRPRRQPPHRRFDRVRSRSQPPDSLARHQPQSRRDHILQHVAAIQNRSAHGRDRDISTRQNTAQNDIQRGMQTNAAGSRGDQARVGHRDRTRSGFQNHRPRLPGSDSRRNLGKKFDIPPGQQRHMPSSRHHTHMRRQIRVRAARLQQNIPATMRRHSPPFAVGGIQTNTPVRRANHDISIPGSSGQDTVIKFNEPHRTSRFQHPPHNEHNRVSDNNLQRIRLQNIDTTRSSLRVQSGHRGPDRVALRPQRSDSRARHQTQSARFHIHRSAAAIENRTRNRRDGNTSRSPHSPQPNIARRSQLNVSGPSIDPAILRHRDRTPGSNHHRPQTAAQHLRARQNRIPPRKKRNMAAAAHHVGIHVQQRFASSRLQENVPRTVRRNRHSIRRRRPVVERQTARHRPNHDRAVPRNRSHIRLNRILNRFHRRIRANLPHRHRDIAHRQRIRLQNINSARSRPRAHRRNRRLDPVRSRPQRPNSHTRHDPQTVRGHIQMRVAVIENGARHRGYRHVSGRRDPTQRDVLRRVQPNISRTAQDPASVHHEYCALGRFHINRTASGSYLPRLRDYHGTIRDQRNMPLTGNNAPVQRKIRSRAARVKQDIPAPVRDCRAIIVCDHRIEFKTSCQCSNYNRAVTPNSLDPGGHASRPQKERRGGQNPENMHAHGNPGSQSIGLNHVDATRTRSRV